MSFQPAYQALYQRGEFKGRVDQALELLESCRVCARACGVNRLRDERGKCATGRWAQVSSYGPHFGEEAPLVGVGGSGTIFFAHCNLRCVFCQNYTISQLGEGEAVTPRQLASMMLALQRRGCHNINLVSPSHVVPQVLEALELACGEGLSVPLVYNSGGYDSVETLHILDGVVDIYMPDLKYADEAAARRYSGIKDYPMVSQAAVKEMHRQVGDLQLDEDGIARWGLLVRHLVLPNGLAGTTQVARFLAREVSPQTYLNVMAQYHPEYRAYQYPELSRSPTREEFSQALAVVREAGLTRLHRPRLFSLV